MSKKIYVIRYSDVTFVALFAVFVIATATGLSGISSYSDIFPVGLTITLAAYTIALQLINQRQNPSKNYQFDSAELQANLYECEREARLIKENSY
jgi:hypothetical protein